MFIIYDYLKQAYDFEIFIIGIFLTLMPEFFEIFSDSIRTIYFAVKYFIL